MRKPPLPYLSLFVLIATLSACKWEQAGEKDNFTIVTTTNIMADGIKALVKDSAEVIPMMATGVDPHLYKASQRDLDLLFEADLVVFHGLHLEGKMVEVLRKFSRTHDVIDQGTLLPKNDLLADPEYANATDPHIWFDVQLWKKALTATAAELVVRKPDWKTYVEANLSAYQSRLDSLDRQTRESIRKVTAQGQVLITAHDAFSYFGQAYDIEVKGLQGLSTLSEPGLRDVSELVSFIIQHKIKAIFVEQSISPKALEAVVEGCRRRGHEVKLAGPLYTDSLGDAEDGAGTYIDMVSANVKTIVDNLE